jgi:hypothetical protein
LDVIRSIPLSYNIVDLLRQILCIIKKKELLLKNKSKFVSLRRILPILSFILLTAITSQAQGGRSAPPTETGEKVKLYPNPATSYITFDIQKNYQRGMSIQVFHFLGRKMYETQNVGEKTTLNLGEFSRGVYIYHVRDMNGKLIDSGKFQVSK